LATPTAKAVGYYLTSLRDYATMTNLFIGIALGLALGGVIGWLLGSRRRPIVPADNRLEEELRQQLEQRELELPQLRTQLVKVGEQNVELSTQLKFLNEQLITERRQIEALQQKFQKDFESVSNKLLVNNSSQFNKQSS
jgi:esterase/lipase